MLRGLSGIVMLVVLSAAPAFAAGVRGDGASIAAAERLLERAGGRDAWANAHTFYVEERAFLRSGAIAEIRIWRDFVAGARRLERRVGSDTYIEWLSKERGWSTRNGTREVMTPEVLVQERQGLRQEPYAIYRRLAVNDPGLRVELRNEGAQLFVFDADERILCWFNLAGDGGLRGWANFYDGAINEHYYGPVGDMGDANLPRWGVQSTGGFRFEYLRARFLNEPAAEPAN